jgi:hypothetical protein
MQALLWVDWIQRAYPRHATDEERDQRAELRGVAARRVDFANKGLQLRRKVGSPAFQGSRVESPRQTRRFERYYWSAEYTQTSVLSRAAVAYTGFGFSI